MASYKQFKVSVDAGLAESFKAVCANAGVSMATEIAKFMALKTDKLPVLADKTTTINPSYDTRRKRRSHVRSILLLLETIKQHEEAYLSRIPDNLQSGQAYDDAELSIDNLGQAIDLLREAY